MDTAAATLAMLESVSASGPAELQGMGGGMDSCPRNKDVALVYLRDSSGLYH